MTKKERFVKLRSLIPEDTTIALVLQIPLYIKELNKKIKALFRANSHEYIWIVDTKNNAYLITPNNIFISYEELSGLQHLIDSGSTKEVVINTYRGLKRIKYVYYGD